MTEKICKKCRVVYEYWLVFLIYSGIFQLSLIRFYFCYHQKRHFKNIFPPYYKDRKMCLPVKEKFQFSLHLF